MRYTVSASKRPELVRKPQQVLAARFKLCGRKPLRGLPPSPRWTWRCASREANVRNGLDAYARRRGTYLSPNASANAFRNFVLRLAVQIWRDYQDHINARIKYADPDEDDKRRHEEEAQASAEEQELAARRLFNEAYLQRMGRPQAFGLC